jgi:hypothetical protein
VDWLNIRHKDVFSNNFGQANFKPQAAGQILVSAKDICNILK